MVLVVDAALGRRLALRVQQMAEVVEEGGGDERIARLGLLRAPRRLQGVL